VGLARQIAALLFIVALPVAFVTTNIRIAVNSPELYEYAADHYDTPQTVGIARSEVLRASSELRDYFKNDEATILVRVQRDGAPVSLFNAEETQHLRDVKALMQGSFRAQEAAVLFVLAYVVFTIIWGAERKFRSLAKQVLASGLVTLVVVGALGVVAVSGGFESAWEQFHVIAFTNDLWQLEPSQDALIQMFPEAFWQDVTVWIGIATLAQMSLLCALSAIFLAATRNSTVSFSLTQDAQPLH